jgi:hypothetical protein
MTAAGERSGVLVIRAWVDGDPPRLKARIIQAIDPTRDEPEAAAVSSTEELCAEIRRWVEALERGRFR